MKFTEWLVAREGFLGSLFGGGKTVDPQLQQLMDKVGKNQAMMLWQHKDTPMGKMNIMRALSYGKVPDQEPGVRGSFNAASTSGSAMLGEKPRR